MSNQMRYTGTARRPDRVVAAVERLEPSDGASGYIHRHIYYPSTGWQWGSEPQYYANWRDGPEVLQVRAPRFAGAWGYVVTFQDFTTGVVEVPHIVEALRELGYELHLGGD